MEIKIFENPVCGTCRTLVGEDGEILFVASDVAKCMGYSHTPHMTRMLDEEEKGVRLVDTPSGKQTVTIITESGFYHAALKSRVEKAKLFRRWVTSEVIPQIRKTGGYIPITPSDASGGEMGDTEILSRALLIAQKTIELKNGLLEAQKPKVMFAEAVTAQDDSILIRDLAKLITQNGINIGQGRMFYWLRANGYLFQRETRPIQKWVEEGLFETNITLINTHHGTKERCTTKVTGKGQQYFVNGFLTGKFSAENGK